MHQRHVSSVLLSVSSETTTKPSASTPRWSLRQLRRLFEVRCLWACHSPSPMIFSPVESMARWIGPSCCRTNSGPSTVAPRRESVVWCSTPGRHREVQIHQPNQRRDEALRLSQRQAKAQREANKLRKGGREPTSTSVTISTQPRRSPKNPISRGSRPARSARWNSSGPSPASAGPRSRTGSTCHGPRWPTRSGGSRTTAWSASRGRRARAGTTQRGAEPATQAADWSTRRRHTPGARSL